MPLRSYYRPYPRPAAVPAASGHTPRRSRTAAVVFSVTLVLIVALAVVLAILTRPALLPEGTGGITLPPAGQSGGSGEAPSIPLADTTDGFSLPLVSAEEREILSFQDNYQKNIDSIVGIYVFGQGFSGFGTGVILTEDGYVVTNAHVVEDAAEVMVILYDGAVLECTLAGFDPLSDLAVLKVEPESPLHPAEFGSSDELQVGDTALALGNPLGSELWGTMTDGIISAINRNVEMDDGTTMTLIQTTAALNSGNSGGALLNDRGQVVGITNMKIMADDNTIEGLGFAIPSTLVKQAVDAMITTGTFTGTPSLGITASALYDPEGVMIRSVNPASDAAEQGVRAGDRIVAVNGTPVHSVDEVNALKAGMAVGEVLTLTVVRGEEELTFQVTLVGAYTLN